MNRTFRWLMLFICFGQAVLAGVFILRLPLATALWPFPYSNDLAFIFIGSIFAAAVVPTFWCVWTKEYGALAGIMVDYVVMLVPASIFAWQLSGGQRSSLILFSLVLAITALFGLGMLLWSWRVPVRDARPSPRFVRVVFVIYIVALLIVGGLLVNKSPNILPWQVTSASSTLYGWFFLGAASYFAFALFRRTWANTVGQLLGFLAYDLVLIVPFLLQFSTVAESQRLSLITYTLVVTISGCISIYYCFVHPQWRIIKIR